MRVVERWRPVMVDDREDRLTRYRADLDAAAAADLTRRHLQSREARSHVLDKFRILNHMPVHLTEEEVTMIDLQTPSHTDEHRKGPKWFVVAGLLAAAAVAAIAIVAIHNDDPVSPADQPPPTVTAPPTVPPRALFGTPDEQFVPGTYYLDEVSGFPTPKISITLGDGWSNLRDGVTIDGRGGVMAFSRPDHVPFDACHTSEGWLTTGSETTLDDLVTALSEQQGWVNVTTPTNISVNGYAGKEFQRTAPADVTGCSGDEFRGWDGYDGGWTHYEPGEIETLRVLDLNGTTIVINTRLQSSDAAAAAGLAAPLDSIRIDQT